ncbi:TPA: hypothetical protein UM046_004312 [Stenotrophomonas maltophilia]|nr:hypothetical protein [Stenotrophomonas maltophilia]HEL3786496.1 hypothetical protein [Stenotrophomonas maltophilia]
MTTHNKTLADVQPGGKVRLGDGVRCSKCKDRGYFDVDVDADDSGGSIGNIEACPHCALSAQPSPGGQGVALHDAVGQIFGCDGNPWRTRDVAAVLRDYAALAALQPVGEPVAWMTHHDDPMLFPTAAEAAAYCEDDEQPVPLFRSPVQAVDLGQLPRYEPIGSEGMNMERVADGRWVKRDEVLALIDSKEMEP